MKITHLSLTVGILLSAAPFRPVLASPPSGSVTARELRALPPEERRARLQEEYLKIERDYRLGIALTVIETPRYVQDSLPSTVFIAPLKAAGSFIWEIGYELGALGFDIEKAFVVKAVLTANPHLNYDLRPASALMRSFVERGVKTTLKEVPGNFGASLKSNCVNQDPVNVYRCVLDIGTFFLPFTKAKVFAPMAAADGAIVSAGSGAAALQSSLTLGEALEMIHAEVVAASEAAAASAGWVVVAAPAGGGAFPVISPFSFAKSTSPAAVKSGGFRDFQFEGGQTSKVPPTQSEIERVANGPQQGGSGQYFDPVEKKAVQLNDMLKRITPKNSLTKAEYDATMGLVESVEDWEHLPLRLQSAARKIRAELGKKTILAEVSPELSPNKGFQLSEEIVQRESELRANVKSLQDRTIELKDESHIKGLSAERREARLRELEEVKKDLAIQKWNVSGVSLERLDKQIEWATSQTSPDTLALRQESLRRANVELRRMQIFLKQKKNTPVALINKAKALSDRAIAALNSLPYN